ncbi:MAG: hypothetical protein U0165_09725 [Polyangiaceae bacterium]
MTTNLLAAAALALVSSLGLFATTEGASAPQAKVALTELAPLSSVELWSTTVQNAIPDAAAACGVVAIKNAPATIVVTFDANGAVKAATSESSLFGGFDTDACLRNELRSLSRAGAPSTETTLRTSLVEIQAL